MNVVAGVTATPYVPPQLGTPATPATGAKGPQESAFARALSAVTNAENAADATATGVATGSIEDIHQFTLAAAKANLAVKLTAAVRNHAVEAYQDIMRMQI